MKRYLFSLWFVMILLVAGCATLTGTNQDGTRNPVGAVIDAVVQGAQNAPLPYVGWIATMLGWGIREYRHKMLIAAGKKDDDHDGMEDPPAAPAT